MRRLLALSFVVALAVVPACGSELEDEPSEGKPSPTPEETPTPVPTEFEAYCTIQVQGVGELDMEEDYLPHVIQCENDGAGPEALRAQAISARSYAYYKIGESGSVVDGQGDQVYSCNKTPQARHYEAVAATAGQFYLYEDTVVAAFYVAGADPGDRDTCVATNSDPDPTNTEKYVTYNEGLSGDDLEQTSLGWVNAQNWANRGCMGQWGSRCLDQRGDNYDTIGRFYYGADIGRVQAYGPCVPGSNPNAVRRVPPVKLPPEDVVVRRWGVEQRIGH